MNAPPAEPSPTAPAEPVVVVVLAAGEGKRMRSSLPKVMHEIGGHPLLGHVLRTVRAVDPAEVVVVVGHAREVIAPYVTSADPHARTVVQDEQRGTGHAVRLALESVDTEAGTVVVVAGDVPMLAPETLRGLLAVHAAENDEGIANAATILSARLDDPTGYGRIIRDPADGSVLRIVEQRDARASEALVDEVNSGTYAFDAASLRRYLDRVGADNAAGEEYLTDVIGLLRDDDRAVGAVLARDPNETQGINDQVQLAEVRRLLRDRVLRGWMRAGVTVIDPETTWVDVNVELEAEAVLLPNTHLHGRTRVARRARIGPNTTLADTVVGLGASVTDATCLSAEIGPEATVGPYTYLRPGTVLARGAKAGGFVEMKNARLGAGSKVPHLSYVGDAEIGEGTNIGAATVFVNYDGQDKHRTVVGDHVRVGSDSMLVAPVEIGDGAYTAAGSVITDDVPPGAMAVARARQRNVEGWVRRKRPGSAAARAAEAALDGHESMGTPGHAAPGRELSETEEQTPVTGIKASGQKTLMLFTGRAHPELAEAVAKELGAEITPTTAYDFANGEIFVRFEESVRGCDAFVIQSHSAPLNDKIMEQLIMVDALKRASAKRITVVVPFYGYARQDKKHRGREPISARLMADLFKTAGANRMMAVDLHTSQIQGFFDGPVDHLFALPLLADHVGASVADRSSLTVVSPDAGRVRVAERWTDRLSAPLAIIHKRRDPDVPNEAKVFEVVGNVEGRTCVIVDDMIDTGGTIVKAADALFENGAADVVVAATHAVLSGPAVDRLKNSRISEVVVTDTLPIPEERRFDKLTVLPIAPILANAISQVFTDGSVTSLFDGHS